MNLAALWRLPVVFLVVNNQYGMGTALSRHSAVTDLAHKADCLGVPGERVDGMDVLAMRECVAAHLRVARERRQPTLIEAITYRFRGHSAADPEVYRTKEEVEQWRERDPILVFRRRLEEEGLIDEREFEQRRAVAVEVVDRAVEFAEQSPDPPLESLYDDIYVLGDQVQGWYSVDERTPEVHRGEDERVVGTKGVPAELAEAGAAYADSVPPSERRRSHGDEHEPERLPEDEGLAKEGGS
jgi:TPP-dependent pyruvate/acetoin dehydrogenase alpha subunit